MRDLVVSPGFIGVALILAAVVAGCAVLDASRRARRRSEQQQDRTRDDAANALAWERWQWVVDRAGIEPAASEGATLGLGPAVTLELLGGLLREAGRLGDETLAKAVAAYQEQLVLVLAQQAGPIAEEAPEEAATTGAETPSPATKVPVSSSGGRRRR